MSGSQAGVAVSLAAHAIAGVLAAGWASTSPPRAPAAARAPASEPEPIEIVMYVEPAAPLAPAGERGAQVPAPAAGLAGTARLKPEPRRTPPVDRVPALPAAVPAPAIDSTSAQLPAVSAAPRGTDAELANRLPEPAPSLRARGLPALPSTPTIDRIVAQPSPPGTPPGAVPAHSTFTMRVDRDGTARLVDRRNLHFALGTSAAEVEEGRAAEWLEQHHERSIAVDAKLPPAGAVVARFDVTDWAMRTKGQDPYAHEKLRVLDATRDARAQMRARRTSEQALETPALVRARLDDIVTLAPGPRSAALLELWADLDDSTAGQVARATILAYVRTHAAFTSSDRAALGEP